MQLPSNQLLDRYLKSVATFLPADQKEDILRELGEDLRSQMEDKESELRRPLTEAEEEAILKQHGHPLVVASRYRHDQRSVSFGRRFIGPVLFAPYARVLSFNLGISSSLIIILFTALFVAGQHVSIFDGLSSLLYQCLLQFAVITGIFSVMQAQLDRHPDRWTAKKSFHFDFSSKIYESAAKDSTHVSRFESICVIVASAVGLVWFTAVRRNPYLIFFSAATQFTLGPVWNQIYIPSVVLIFASMLRALLNLIWPDWVRLRDVGRIAIDSASLGIVLVLLKAGDWIILQNPAAAADVRRAVVILNQSVYYSLWATAAIIFAMILVNLWRLIRRELHRHSSSAESLASHS